MNNQPIRDIFTDDEPRQSRMSASLAVARDDIPVTPIRDDFRQTRYLFNPFIIADLRDMVAPVGHAYLRNGQFIKISQVSNYRRPTDMDDLQASPLSALTGHDANLYNVERRQPGHITAELIAVFTEGGVSAGVSEIKALRGVDDDEFVKKMTVWILGEDIPVTADIYNDQFPCPNLRAWFEQIEANTRALESKFSEDRQAVALVRGIFSDLQISFRLAIQYANTKKAEALENMLDPDSKNKRFTPLQRRAFLALGEQIPDQMPFKTSAEVNRANQPQIVYVQPQAPQPQTPNNSPDMVDLMRRMEEKERLLDQKLAELDARDIEPQPEVMVQLADSEVKVSSSPEGEATVTIPPAVIKQTAKPAKTK